MIFFELMASKWRSGIWIGERTVKGVDLPSVFITWSLHYIWLCQINVNAPPVRSEHWTLLGGNTLGNFRAGTTKKTRKICLFHAHSPFLCQNRNRDLKFRDWTKSKPYGSFCVMCALDVKHRKHNIEVRICSHVQSNRLRWIGSDDVKNSYFAVKIATEIAKSKKRNGNTVNVNAWQSNLVKMR